MVDELKIMVGEQAYIVVIPTWTDTTSIKPLPKISNPFVREHLPSAEFVIMYSGNLGATHAIETIIEVAEHLRADSRIQLLIVGDGAKYAQVGAAIASGRTPNIKLLPLQPLKVVPYSFASADIAFVTLALGYERLSLPSKTYDMMAAGCVIVGISQAGSGLDILISKHACGMNFEPDQADSIATWISDLVHNKNHMYELKQNARRAAVEHYSEEYCSPQLTEIVLARLGKRSS
jgi:glycosyltransferase involved in cell wall biosynthesis